MELRPQSALPPVVKNLILINALVWLASLVLPRTTGIDLTDWLGLHYWEAERFNLGQLISYMFMHDTGSFSHLLFNMFALWMFGKDLEYVWGPRRFLFYYMLTGIGAGLSQELVWTLSLHDLSQYQTVYTGAEYLPVADYLNLPVTVGASGSVFGLMAAFAFVFPQARIFLLFPPISLRAPWFVAIYALIELYGGISTSGGDHVAHFAHLGGLVFGFLLLFYWKKHGKLYGGEFE
ncbi:MAG: rhomboid family intramembrane serine protease [Paludibacteraceae bacterium]|nr:rhomboid family intramembrane serine protease [Paludibacteraceae bacterium]